MGGFNESDHPRVPAGSPQGGEFTSKGGAAAGVTFTHRSVGLDVHLAQAGKKYLQRNLTKEMVAEIAGAPPGSKVFIEVSDHIISVVSRTDAGYYSQREINLKKRSVLNEESKNPNPGKGEGLDIFARQVDAARKMGLHRIETYAAGRGKGEKGGGKEGNYNGYYSWARMGFMPVPDANFPSIQSQTAVDRHGNRVNLIRLMSTKAGRDYWKDNGQGFHASFDLRPSSISSRVLDAYIQSKRS